MLFRSARFSTVENAVVFSSQGPRSLPSCLAGGDLDGDLYLLITSPSLFPTRWEAPASYEPSSMKSLNRDATIDDGIDFFLERESFYLSSNATSVFLTALLHFPRRPARPHGPNRHGAPRHRRQGNHFLAQVPRPRGPPLRCGRLREERYSCREGRDSVRSAPPRLCHSRPRAQNEGRGLLRE